MNILGRFCLSRGCSPCPGSAPAPWMCCSLRLEVPPGLGISFQHATLPSRGFFGSSQVRVALSGGDSRPKSAHKSPFCSPVRIPSQRNAPWMRRKSSRGEIYSAQLFFSSSSLFSFSAESRRRFAHPHS